MKYPSKNEQAKINAIDLPRFLQASNREKADTLLQVIGVGDQVRSLEVKEKEVYNRRHMIGQEADRKRKYADELPHYPAAPNEPVSASQLIRQQQDILARNGYTVRIGREKRGKSSAYTYFVEYHKEAPHDPVT